MPAAEAKQIIEMDSQTMQINPQLLYDVQRAKGFLEGLNSKDTFQRKEVLDLVKALELIAESKGKTLLGCGHDEYHHDECEGKKAHEIGANKAFEQDASIAIEALNLYKEAVK